MTTTPHTDGAPHNEGARQTEGAPHPTPAPFSPSRALATAARVLR
ncbi:hypothetical protein [Streptomyces nigrescens]|uniref:Uncharacterized protein n=1 Tax=Streptomyces nigrescens TaxID=1920 RepID=A0ABY7J249_STRNI|nr:hypothetical protein [Streptomyces nigrescens]WAU05342.1 hypothetical protein STRNI_003709 [Streptomyces nigrescens]